jgi:acetoacetyl-CoA synthetase
VNDKPGAVTIDELTKIWERVLQRFPIAPEDNFFDLGGGDSQADDLFSEIAKLCGRVLPSATICHAPTIKALDALLARPALPQFPPFVQLKAGNEKPPILITHGLGGRASFSQLAKHIRTGHPIYGIQARGVDGLEEPLDRIEDMAEFYLNALSALQPQGPYILIGYSFGGLIALEMAQRLSHAGKSVALLVLVDTYPHPRYMTPDQRAWLFAKRIKGHISKMKQMPISAAFSYLLHAVQRRMRTAGSHDRRILSPQAGHLSFAQAISRVKQSDFGALRCYRPRFYRGKIRFIRPEANSYLPNDPTAVWKRIAHEFEVETVPGDHLGMVGTHFESLAAVLTRYVEESSEQETSQP